eukprot:gene5305-949_t
MLRVPLAAWLAWLPAASGAIVTTCYQRGAPIGTGGQCPPYTGGEEMLVTGGVASGHTQPVLEVAIAAQSPSGSEDVEAVASAMGPWDTVGPEFLLVSNFAQSPRRASCPMATHNPAAWGHNATLELSPASPGALAVLQLDSPWTLADTSWP